jgi:quinol monooxygenase YgiN
MIHLAGTLTCPKLDDLKIIETYLPEHTRLSRAEPGCLSFNVSQTANPLVWQLDETYVDQAAFDAHQTRNRASIWWQMSQGLVRDFKLTTRPDAD